MVKREDRGSLLDAGLRPALRPAQPLLPERRPGRRRQLVRDDVGVVHRLGVARDGAQGRVNVLGQHAGVHAHGAQQGRAPVAVGAREQAEPPHGGAARVRDGVDLVELDGDERGEPRVARVEDDAAALHHVDAPVRAQPLGRPARRVRVHVVVAVVDGDDVGARVAGQEVVEVVRLGRRVGHPDDAQVTVLGGQVAYLRLKGLDRLRRVVHDVDADAIARVHDLLERVERAVQDDVALVGQVGDDDEVDDRQLRIRRREDPPVLLGLHHRLARLPDGRQRDEGLNDCRAGDVEVRRHVHEPEDGDEALAAHAVDAEGHDDIGGDQQEWRPVIDEGGASGNGMADPLPSRDATHWLFFCALRVVAGRGGRRVGNCNCWRFVFDTGHSGGACDGACSHNLRLLETFASLSTVFVSYLGAPTQSGKSSDILFFINSKLER